LDQGDQAVPIGPRTTWDSKRKRFGPGYHWTGVVGDLTEDVIRTGSFVSVAELVRDIKAYLAERNANPKPYKWKAKGRIILEKICRAREALDKMEAA
jgi:hypothetical protein